MFKRMPLEIFTKNADKTEDLPENAIGAYFNMPVKLIVSSKRLILANSGKYILKNPCLEEFGAFSPAGITFYIKGKYSKSGKKELLATFWIQEIVENLTKENSDEYKIGNLFEKGDFEITILEYTEIFSGDKKSVKSKKNIKALKARMGGNHETLDVFLSKKNLKDF